jgi:hypothetical protein
MTHVFTIRFFFLAGTQGYGFPRFSKKLIRLLIHTTGLLSSNTPDKAGGLNS